MRFISIEEYLMGRAKMMDLPPEWIGNLNRLVPTVNELLSRFGEYRAIRSGFRRPEDNAKVAQPKGHSSHLTCQAVDLEDNDRRLTQFITGTPIILVELGLYMEHPSATPTWVHVQTRPVPSGHRIFYP